jgi:hypothetical protein
MLRQARDKRKRGKRKQDSLTQTDHTLHLFRLLYPARIQAIFRTNQTPRQGD